MVSAATDTKRCSKCRLFKPTTEFNNKSYCKPCENEYKREYRRNRKNRTDLKVCPKCGLTKEFKEFTNDGLCKPCTNLFRLAADVRKNPNKQRKEILPEGKKRCGRCLLIFDADKIYKARCLECRNAIKRERYHKLKEKDPNIKKLCTKCDQEKPLSDYTNPMYSICRQCHLETYYPKRGASNAV